MAKQKKKVIVNTLIKKTGRPREKQRTKTYFDIEKVKKIFIKNNPEIDPLTVTTVFIHAILKKKHPERCPTYQTLINLGGQTGKQFDMFMLIKEIVGAEYMDDLLTIPE